MATDDDPRIDRRAWLAGSSLLAAALIAPGCAGAGRSAPSSSQRSERMQADEYDVVIAGGGPAGLSAALVLGRARKRVLLCDAGVPRNAAAARVHGFVTRDGTPPQEFRRVAREQLAAYPNVEAREARVRDARGARGSFEVALEGALDGGAVRARRLLLAVGVVDELPALPGARELWGTAIFQCPYCHGWEVRDRAFGYLAPGPEWLEWALFLTGWSADVVAFTGGAFAVSPEVRARLAAGGVGLEERRVQRLVAAAAGGLAAVELEGGERVAREVLFARPRQRQLEVVGRLGLALDEQGYVRVGDQMETSRSGVYAAGDLTTMRQGALMAAAAGAQAAYAINHELTMERAAQRAGGAAG